VERGLLPGDAVARAHAHHLLDLCFGVIGEFDDFDAPCLRVPFENIRKETDARFAVGAFSQIDDRIFLQYLYRVHGFRFRGRVLVDGLNGVLFFPRKIVAIGEARSEFTGSSFAVLSPAQAAPGLAAQLALFAIRAFFFGLRSGHSFSLSVSPGP